MKNLVKISEMIKKYDKTMQILIERKVYETEDLIYQYSGDVLKALTSINNDSYYVLPDTFFYIKINNTVNVRILCRWINDNIEIHSIYNKNNRKGDDSQYIREFESYVDIYLSLYKRR